MLISLHFKSKYGKYYIINLNYISDILVDNDFSRELINFDTVAYQSKTLNNYTQTKGRIFQKNK